MNVEAIMTPDPMTVRKGARIERVMELMDERGFHHLPVVEEEGLVGIVSDRDVLEATGWLSPAPGAGVHGPYLHVADVMHAPVVSCELEDELGVVLERFVQGRIGCLPVVQHGKVVGIVTDTDILRAYTDACRRGEVVAQDDPRVEQCMTPLPRSIDPDASGDEAAEVLREIGIRHLPVVGGEGLVGILSDRDVRRARGRGQLQFALVSELMTPDPVLARPQEGLSSVALILAAQNLSALPVVYDGRPIGIVSRLDVLLPCARVLQKLW